MKWFFLLRSTACVLMLGYSLQGWAANSDLVERTKACVACHGDQGRAGPDGYYPRLAGKPAGYLYNQMENFSEGRRRYALMRRMMEPLSPSYQRELADYFAHLQVPYVQPSTTGATVSSAQLERGRLLVTKGDAQQDLPACVSCHGETMMGRGQNVPGLLGLPAAYLGAQLAAWKSGDRRATAPDCMADIAKRLQPEDAKAVVAWLSTQAVPPQTSVSASVAPSVGHAWRCGSAPDLHRSAP